jgi:hypothetical protein
VGQDRVFIKNPLEGCGKYVTSGRAQIQDANLRVTAFDADYDRLEEYQRVRELLLASMPTSASSGK